MENELNLINEQIKKISDVAYRLYKTEGYSRRVIYLCGRISELKAVICGELE